ncbi:MAG: DUF6675 family protein [Spirochaetia bacterium]
MRKAIYSITVALLVLSGAVYAGNELFQEFGKILPLENLSEEQIEELQVEGETLQMENTASTELAPEVMFSGRSLGDYIHSLGESEPNISIQYLFLIPLKKMYSNLEIYNALLSVSTMTGIEYFSHSRQRYRVFYHEVYPVEDLDRDTRIRDPQVSGNDLPGEKELYIYQHDSSFGKYYSKLQYLYDGKSFILSMENETSLRYKLIRVLKPGKLQIRIYIKPESGNLLLYAHCSAEAASLFGLASRIEKSLSNRLRAIADWFTGTLTQY